MKNGQRRSFGLGGPLHQGNTKVDVEIRKRSAELLRRVLPIRPVCKKEQRVFIMSHGNVSGNLYGVALFLVGSLGRGPAVYVLVCRGSHALDGSETWWRMSKGRVDVQRTSEAFAYG